jgi:hypothetical protein
MEILKVGTCIDKVCYDLVDDGIEMILGSKGLAKSHRFCDNDDRLWLRRGSHHPMNIPKQPRLRREQLLRELYQISLAIAVLKHALSAANSPFCFAEKSRAGGDLPPYLKG